MSAVAYFVCAYEVWKRVSRIGIDFIIVVCKALFFCSSIKRREWQFSFSSNFVGCIGFFPKLKNLKFAIEQMLLTEGTGEKIEKIISDGTNDEDKRNILCGAILQVDDVLSLRRFFKF
jgi:hypothetical protein